MYVHTCTCTIMWQKQEACETCATRRMTMSSGPFLTGSEMAVSLPTMLTLNPLGLLLLCADIRTHVQCTYSTCHSNSLYIAQGIPPSSFACVPATLLCHCNPLQLTSCVSVYQPLRVECLLPASLPVASGTHSLSG